MPAPQAHTIRTNAQATIEALLRQLKVSVMSQTIRQTLQQHPDFPSLLSLSDALDEWQVDNAAIQLNHVEQLRELPTPFIVHSTQHGGLYLLIEAVANGIVTSLDPANKHRQTEPIEQFAKHWSGVVLMAEKTDQSGEADYQTHRRQEVIENLRWPSVLMGAVLSTSVILLALGENLSLLGWLWLLTKSMGLGLSLLLVQKQLGHANALTDKLCKVTGKTGCDEVLNAPAATLGGILPWSDVGLLYFSGGLLLSLLAGFQPNLWPLVSLIALLALPYTVFSLYYQGVVARQWCTLCLGVQAILLTEGVLAIVQGVSIPNTMQPYSWTMAALLLPVLGWLAIKPTLQQATETEPLRRKLARLQNNPNLFEALLHQQPQAPGWLPDSVVTLGHPDAEHVITVVTNPFCGPCTAAHRAIEELLSKQTMIRVEIIFRACDGQTGRITAMLQHLLSFGDADRMSKALNSWYSQDKKDYSVWTSQWPTEFNPIAVAISKQHCDWCEAAKVEGTPTIFINGYELPALYRLADLRWVLTVANTVSTLEST